MKTAPYKTIRVWRGNTPEDVIISTGHGDLMMNKLKHLLQDPEIEVEFNEEIALLIVSAYIKKTKAMRRKDVVLDNKSDQLSIMQKRLNELCDILKTAPIIKSADARRKFNEIVDSLKC